MDSKLTWLVLVGAAALIFLLTAAQKRRVRRPLLVGDSLALGLRNPLAVELERRGLGLASATRGGTTAAYWAPRLGALLREHQPDLVLISVGTNDCSTADLVTCKDFRANTRDLMAQCHTAGVRVVFLLPPWLAWRDRIAERLTAGADSFEPTGRVELQPDKIHPTGAGYRAWAGELARKVLP